MAYLDIDGTTSRLKPTVNNNSDGTAVDINDKRLIMRSKLQSMANVKHVDNQPVKKFEKFNRYRNNEGQDYLSSGIGYIFITKPHLNLACNDNIDDPYLLSIHNGRGSGLAKRIVNSLDGVYGGDRTTPFIQLITNSAETFETKDNILKTKEYGYTFFVNKISVVDNETESFNGDTFTIEYTEYSDLALTYLHKTWVDYIHAVKFNTIQPYKTDVNNYIHHKIIDYASAMYYFLVAEDGYTIKYYAKYTGVFPINIPYSALSFNLGESKVKKLSVQYQYSFKEDLDPRILDEFAYLTKDSNGVVNTTYNLNNTWCKQIKLSDDKKKLVFVQ